MGLKDFKILFDNPWSTYYCGQTASGRVVLVLDAPKKIRGVNIKIKGEANTCWSSSKRELNNEGRYEDGTQTLTGHEEYFNVQYYLHGSATGNEIQLPAGEHTYPFHCPLPPNLPSSFESDFGHVRYTVKAILDRPWKFDQEVKTAFTVISPFDLNQNPRALEPVQQEMSKNFCCLCCASAPLTINISLPVRGYVPGQIIPVTVNVENHSGVTVDTVKLILRKIVTYHSTTPRVDTMTNEIIVAQVSKGPVEGNETTTYEQSLEVPPLPPSNLDNCRILDLEYNLQIEACVSAWYHRNLKGDTLVFVGTIPLANYQTPIVPPAGSGMDDYSTKSPDPTYGGYPSGYPPFTPGGEGYPTAPPAEKLSTPPGEAPAQPQPASNLYPSLPPPSYEESVYGARSIRDSDESQQMLGLRNHFAPRYPVYHFGPRNM